MLIYTHKHNINIMGSIEELRRKRVKEKKPPKKPPEKPPEEKPPVEYRPPEKPVEEKPPEKPLEEKPPVKPPEEYKPPVEYRPPGIIPTPEIPAPKIGMVCQWLLDELDKIAVYKSENLTATPPFISFIIYRVIDLLFIIKKLMEREATVKPSIKELSEPVKSSTKYKLLPGDIKEKDYSEEYFFAYNGCQVKIRVVSVIEKDQRKPKYAQVQVFLIGM